MLQHLLPQRGAAAGGALSYHTLGFHALRYHALSYHALNEVHLQVGRQSQFLHRTPFFQIGAQSGFEMCFGPSTLRAGAKARVETRVKRFTPHCVCRAAGRCHVPRPQRTPCLPRRQLHRMHGIHNRAPTPPATAFNTWHI